MTMILMLFIENKLDIWFGIWYAGEGGTLFSALVERKFRCRG